jgi:WD40 repeat protein
VIRDPSPRAYGIAVLSDDAEFFTGRAAALATIGAWLAGPDSPSALVVTGRAGSGKSAVLTRVWQGSRGAPAGDGIDVAVDAYGRTAAEVLAALCTAAGCDGTRAADLLAQTRRRGRPLVAVVDGIDAARDPEHLVTTLLGPLTRASAGDHLRLLLGARATSLGPLTASARVVDLDRPEYSDPHDIHEYTYRCLAEMVEWSPYRVAAPGFVAQVADAIVAAAGTSFLTALIIARNLADCAEPVNPSDPRWRASLPREPAVAVGWDLRTRLGPTDAAAARDLLLPLAYAQGAGLPWDGVWPQVAAAVSGRPFTDDDVSWVRRTVGWYVLEVADAGRLWYRPAHGALAEHVRVGRDDRAVHGAFTAVLAHGVPYGGAGTPDWPAAPPYTRTHIATHAALAGLLDQLLDDPRYLHVADRARLLGALWAAGSPQGRAAAEAYRRMPRQAADALWFAQLELSAHCARATSLASAFDRLHAWRPWKVRWAHWSNPRPCRALAGGHTGAVLAVATVRAGGRRLAVAGGDDGTVRVWDLAAGRPVGPPLSGHGGPVRAVAAVAFGDRAVAIAGGRGGVVHVWDLLTGTGTTVRTPATAEVTAAALVRCGADTWALTGCADGSLSAWDLATGRPVMPVRHAHDGAVRSISAVSYGAWAVAVTVGSDQAVRVWSVGAGDPEGTPLRGRPDGFGAAATLTWRGRTAAITADATGRLDVWDPHDGRYVQTPVSGAAGVVGAMAAAVVNERPVAVTGGPDGVVRVWDLATGQPVYAPLTGHHGAVTAMTIDDGDVPVAVSASADGTVRLWDLTEESVPDPAGTPTANVSAVLADRPAVAASGAQPVVVATGAQPVVVATGDGSVHLLDPDTGEAVGPPVPVHTHGVTAVATGVVKGRPVLLTAAADTRLRRWDLATGELVGRPMPSRGRPVRALVIGVYEGWPLAVAVGDDGAVELWNLHSGESLPPPPAHHGPEPTSVAAVTVDGWPFVVTGHADGTTGIRELLGQHRTGTLAGRHTAPVTAVAAVGSGAELVVVTGGADRCARMVEVGFDERPRWPARASREVAREALDVVPNLAALRLGGDGTPVVAFSSGDDVRLWTPEAPATAMQLPAPATALAFGAGNTLVLGAEHGVVAVAVAVDDPAPVLPGWRGR